MRTTFKALALLAIAASTTSAQGLGDSIFRRESIAKGAAMGFGIAGAIGGGLFVRNFSNGMCGGGPSCSAAEMKAFGVGAVAGGLLGALGGP